MLSTVQVLERTEPEWTQVIPAETMALVFKLKAAHDNVRDSLEIALHEDSSMENRNLIAGIEFVRKQIEILLDRQGFYVRNNRHCPDLSIMEKRYIFNEYGSRSILELAADVGLAAHRVQRFISESRDVMNLNAMKRRIRKC